MPKCPQCEDGVRIVEEDGRRFEEACYHCGNTGTISDEQLAADQVEWAASRIATMMVDRLRAWADANPDGEGWAFAAAENMMSVYEYTTGRHWDCEMKAADALRSLPSAAMTGMVQWALDNPAFVVGDARVDRPAIEALPDKFRTFQDVVLDALDGKEFKPPDICGGCYNERAECSCPLLEVTPAETVPPPAFDVDDEMPF